MEIRVLAIDDEPDILDVYETITEDVPDSKFKGVLYSGDATDAILEFHPHVVIVDYQLPKPLGDTLVHELNTIGYPGKILAISGYPEAEKKFEALSQYRMENGWSPITYLEKPFCTGLVRALIEATQESLKPQEEDGSEP